MLQNTMNATTCTIAELAREFGVTTRTIRFYEDQGLLNPARDGRNRVYNSRDRVRLKLTLRGKRLGLALSEIRELIELYDSAKDEVAQLNRFLDVLSKRKALLEQQREDIEELLVEIQGLELQCKKILKERAPRRAEEKEEAAGT